MTASPTPRAPCGWAAVDFLLKPFHDGDLEQAVCNLQQRMTAESPAPTPTLPEPKKGDKSRYVLEAMDYISTHYNDPGIGVASIAQYLGRQREPSEPHLQAGDGLHPAQLSHPLPHP